MNFKRRRAVALVASLLAGRNTIPFAQEKNAQIQSPPKRPLIVVLPGIGGSVLSVRGKVVWSPTVSGLSQALVTLGGSLADLRLSESDARKPGRDSAGVTADSLVQDLHILPGLWKIDGYSALLASLRALPGTRMGVNLFAFPYDWRRDNRISAQELAVSCHLWLKRWREVSGQSDARIAFVAHSMGGLVARYFIECLEGWKITSALVTMGTPFRGSLNAVSTLHDGQQIFGSLQLPEVDELLRSCTSVYQLLPTYPCIGVDGKDMRVSELSGLRGIDQGRASDGMRFHREIEEAVQKNSAESAYVADRYRIHPVVGTSQRTLQHGELANSSIVFGSAFPGLEIDGDGTVPRPSATPLDLEGKDMELFIAESHGSLQNSDFVLNQIRGLITSPALDWSKFRGRRQGSSLDVPFATLAGEIIEIGGKVNTVVHEAKVDLSIYDARSGTLLKEFKIVCDDSGGFSINVAPLRAAAYRVTATFFRKPLSDVEMVTDTFVVLPSA